MNYFKIVIIVEVIITYMFLIFKNLKMKDNNTEIIITITLLFAYLVFFLIYCMFPKKYSYIEDISYVKKVYEFLETKIIKVTNTVVKIFIVLLVLIKIFLIDYSEAKSYENDTINKFINCDEITNKEDYEIFLPTSPNAGTMKKTYDLNNIRKDFNGVCGITNE